MTEYVGTESAVFASFGRLRDLAALGKPRLSLLVIFTTAVGLWLAPTMPPLVHALVFLLATSALVAAANTLNCWMEKEIDALMARTRERPLPAGRLEPKTALVFGIVLAVVALLLIVGTSNLLTAGLGAIALLVYVLVYTPLKRVTPWAVVVGAVPGALPPLMGWTAASGRIASGGLFLFGILFLWQLPHFIAISLYLKEDFRRGGIRVLPLVHGDRAARAHLFVYAAVLLAFSVTAQPLGIAGSLYTSTALLSGSVWIGLAAAGLRRRVSERWARAFFGYSLLYLPVVLSVLVIDAF